MDISREIILNGLILPKRDAVACDRTQLRMPYVAGHQK
jgi:hypothetical protein